MKQYLILIALMLACAPAVCADICQDAVRGDVASVTSDLSNGASVNAADKDGATALHHAVAGNHVAVVKLLLAHQADVNAKRKNGVTPLHVAAALDRVEIAGVLLNAGAKSDAVDAQGRTPASLVKSDQMAAVLHVPSPAANVERLIAIGSPEKVTLEKYKKLVAYYIEDSPNGAWRVPSFIEGSANGQAQAIRLSDNTVIDLPNESFYCLRQGYGFWSKDGSLLSSANGDRLVRYDLDKGTTPVSLTPAGEKWPYASVSPNGKWVAYENAAGRLTIADLAAPSRRTTECFLPCASRAGSPI